MPILTQKSNIRSGPESGEQINTIFGSFDHNCNLDVFTLSRSKKANARPIATGNSSGHIPKTPLFASASSQKEISKLSLSPITTPL
jgi:hypothetical protein